MELGYVGSTKPAGQRRYGQKLFLTPRGLEIADRISQASLDIQNHVNAGIPEADLIILYRTLGILMENFHRLTEQTTEEQ